MRKGNFFILSIAISLLASAVSLFFMQEAAAINLPMPDVKGQFKKGGLKTGGPMELEADQVSFNAADNKATAKGNVVVTSGDQQLYCDQLQLYRIIQQAVAEGHVYLDAPQEQVEAQGITYNFNRQTGEFRDARVFADPYQIKGRVIDKVSENHMTMNDGYMTTSDWDQPDYRISARRMDIFMKDRAVMHGMKIYLGKVPVMYLPYYVQDLKNRPIWTIIPGESKDFGLFLLGSLRLKVGRHVALTVHSDVRERTGFSEGFDVKYNTPDFGSGIFTAYYTAENKIAGHHLWNEYNSQGVRKGPTTHHERYRFRWRHTWQIDQNTNAVWQVYKIHDYDIVNNGFLKQYFKREYYQNADVNTYFLLTHVMPHGTLNFDITDSRINRPLRGVDRFPEITYTLNNTQIGKTGFYAKSTNTYSNLSYQNYPKTFNEKTMRFDTNNDISHPFKAGFIEFNPHVGGEETYYSRTAYLPDKNIIRGLFRTSLDMSTKFYRVWDYHTNFAGLNINRLRHVITPTITYLYQARPTFPGSLLNQFDPAIDDLFRIHQLELGLENKLQTKRNGQVVDLLRVLFSSNYGLKGTTVGPPAQTTGLGATGRIGLNPVDAAIDFHPTDWFTLHNDDEYDFHAGHFNSVNFDGEVHNKGWSFALGSRYTRQQGDQLTAEWDYTINPKWKLRIYNSYPLTKATNGNITPAIEREYVITRDLHEWEMDLAIDQQQGQGSTFYMLFRLKAFPNMKFNLINTMFHASRPGASTPGSTGES